MVFTIILAVITCITLIISIIKFPTIKIGDKSFETFWMIALIGALLMIATVSVPVEHLIDNLTSNSAINPIKIIFLQCTNLNIFLKLLKTVRNFCLTYYF